MTTRTLFEGGAFVALALALHAGVFVLRPAPAGVSSSGNGGTELLSLQAASASVAEMVAEFDRLAAPAPPAELPVAPAGVSLPTLDLPDLPVLPSAPVEAPLPPSALAAPQPAPDQPPAPPAEPPPETPPEPKPAPEKAADAAPKKRQQSHDSAGQRAAGAGGGTAAGNQGKASVATLSEGKERDLRAEWGAAIRARIERAKRYPGGAAGAEGEVRVQLSVTRSGQLAGVSVRRSSGNAALDAAALQAVQRAKRFPAAPKGLGKDRYDFSLTVHFLR
ncbi:MAG: energy transducer TonB [Proteobacteria bacterium]|nr:energy transducer TonB [Pseudomonadota bacterium]